MNLFDEIFGGDAWMGICDTCRQAKRFTNERERDLWEKHHTHTEA